MRYIVVFLLVAAIVMVFIFADHFPGVLSHYPRIQEMNWTVRAWLGMDSHRPSSLSKQGLKETEKILRKETGANSEVDGENLAEYHD